MTGTPAPSTAAHVATRIRQALQIIAEVYPQTLTPTRRAPATHAIHATAPPPISAATLDTRFTAHIQLVCWAKLTIAGRRLTWTTITTVPALAAFLTIHADWLANHPSAPACVAQLETSASALATIAADNAPRRFVVGRCPGTTNGEPCPGLVKATVRADDDLLPSSLRCSGTPRHEWPSGEWRTLQKRLHMDESAARRLAAAIRGVVE